MERTCRLDLLLVNPGGQERIYQSLAATLTAIEPPVWAGLMATFARNRELGNRIRSEPPSSTRLSSEDPSEG